MSYNIWSDAPLNATWERRKGRMADLLNERGADLIGMQEATFSMIQDLQERLPNYRWIGHGRDDGLQKGEFTPIFFRTDRMRMVEHATFWLAAVCDRPGKGWDAFCKRTVTWGRFEDLRSGRRCVHFNTHLDHLGRRARLESANLLLSKVSEIGVDEPVVVTGDFNCRESSATYRTLVGDLPFAAAPSANSRLRDALRECKISVGPRKTYRGWMSLFGIGRIDYVFVKNGFLTRKHVTIDDQPAVSDHRPVWVELDYGLADA